MITHVRWNWQLNLCLNTLIYGNNKDFCLRGNFTRWSAVCNWPDYDYRLTLYFCDRENLRIQIRIERTNERSKLKANSIVFGLHLQSFECCCYVVCCSLGTEKRLFSLSIIVIVSRVCASCSVFHLDDIQIDNQDVCCRAHFAFVYVDQLAGCEATVHHPKNQIRELMRYMRTNHRRAMIKIAERDIKWEN